MTDPEAGLFPDQIHAGLAAWLSGDLDALTELLDPDVKLLAAEPGPWDCHGRDTVLALLRERRTDGLQPYPVELEELDAHTVIIHRSVPEGSDQRDTTTVATIHHGKVTLMQQYPTRAAALAARLTDST